MENAFIQLFDLPDEILIIIFKKLNNVELLYSLMDVNKRLNQILHDPIFTDRLSLVKVTSNGLAYPLVDAVLDRFCLQIVPKIHNKIKWLSLESLSMERILLATDYPNLCGLGLYNMNEKTAMRFFRGNEFDFHFF
ncbi:unnamed protein product [Rotaria sordida]|uniref:F-box domain-containing protein n=1 Tax=Rotaria sordida TaxID=392033 RepID=A0A819U673_9BILA|nr:unnamed protein product [Rotaria sordida]CAF4098136.1 unnamed protein product [Rotaria sordida]CAF4197331.1 unnamed protein product [Rotaria sordida]